MKEPDLLIPVKKRRRLGGQFVFGRQPLLATSHSSDRLPLRQLRDDLAGLGLAARVRKGRQRPAGPDVYIRRRRQIAGDEAYELTIRPEGVEVTARSAAGVYYGVQTLRELIALHGRRLPAMRIEDGPELRRRAVYHDCSRGKVPTVTTVKALIERLARWKINELQLYIENTFRFRKHPAIGAGYSPFSAEDILAIQTHAKAHHVRLVGSLASFGHLEKVLSLPEYRHLAELSELDPARARGDLCPTDPRSIHFVAELYDEFLPLLEARDFNACCDETSQIGTGRSRRQAEKIGLGRLYLQFVLKLHRLCRSHGKRMNIWGDIILAHPELIGQVPRDIVMCNWDYSPTGRRIDRTEEFVAAGLPLMCCPGTNGWQSHGTRMVQASANIEKFARIARDSGAEGLLNTDWGDCGHRNTLGVSLHGFALGGACAWGGSQVRLRGFTEAFAQHAFGDRSGRLAAALKTLGAWGGSQLYHALLEPIHPRGGWGDRMLGWRVIDSPGLKTGAVRRRLEQVRNLRIPRLAVADRFEALALEEFELARRMDEIACRRILAARTLRAGRNVPARDLRRLAGDTSAMADDFARLWRARNRPSRLRDNLRAMRAAAREAGRIARG